MGGGKTQGRGRGVPLQTWPTSLFSPFPPLRGGRGVRGWSGEKKIIIMKEDGLVLHFLSTLLLLLLLVVYPLKNKEGRPLSKKKKRGLPSFGPPFSFFIFSYS